MLSGVFLTIIKIVRKKIVYVDYYREKIDNLPIFFYLENLAMFVGIYLLNSCDLTLTTPLIINFSLARKVYNFLLTCPHHHN